MIPDINLLPDRGTDERGARTGYVLLGIIAMLLLSVMSWLYFSARADVVSLSNEEQSLQAERDALQLELEELQGTGQGSMKESLTFIEQISYPVTPLIDETKGLLPENTYLRNYLFEQSAVTFTVDFELLNVISTYIGRLEQSPYFLDVQVGEIANFQLGPSGDELNTEKRFSEVPRYTVEVTLLIDNKFLATGGGA